MLSKRKTTRIHEEEKDRSSLFYNKYEWAVAWMQKEINVIRNSLDDYQVEKCIANARYWERQRWQNRWDLTGRKLGDDNFQSTITKAVVDDIHAVRTMLAEHPDRRNHCDSFC